MNSTAKPANDNPDRIDIAFAKLETIMEHCSVAATYMADLAEIVSGERPTFRPDIRPVGNDDDETRTAISDYLLRLGTFHLALSLGIKELFDTLHTGTIPQHLSGADLSRLPALYPPGSERSILDSEPPPGTPEHLIWQAKLAAAFSGGPH